MSAVETTRGLGEGKTTGETKWVMSGFSPISTPASSRAALNPQKYLIVPFESLETAENLPSNPLRLTRIRRQTPNNHLDHEPLRLSCIFNVLAGQEAASALEVRGRARHGQRWTGLARAAHQSLRDNPLR